MDADERLTALKRAYADIILNTAKEAAARIMVSERKAIRFEYELKNAKEDAIQMLLRLKLMMDSKISEAEMTSCTQQKKIEELEAQLTEAEDIVKDLREELRAVQSELEMFPRNNEVKHMVQVIDASSENVKDSKPDLDIDQRDKSRRLYGSLFPLNKSLMGNADLPSIILRSKETELYRNGCTQRIRACERTPLMETNEAKAESIGNEGEKLRETPSRGADAPCNMEDKEVISDQVKEMDVTADNSCLTSPSSVKHTNNTACDEGTNSDKDSVRACDSQSTISVPRVDPIVSQPANDRVIKYTFQRKRKRGALTGGNGSTVRTEENQKACSEKANSIGESTPEKIRLEQVAHQLISLSDNKWW